MDNFAKEDSCRRHFSHGTNANLGVRYGMLMLTDSVSVVTEVRTLVDIAPIELCYNFQYMAKNGRNRGNPWSLRRTGVYQKVDSETGSSCWILLHPSSEVEELAENALRDRVLSYGASNQSALGDPMFLHVLFLSTMVDSWDEYVESLYSQLLISVSITDIF